MGFSDPIETWSVSQTHPGAAAKMGCLSNTIGCNMREFLNRPVRAKKPKATPTQSTTLPHWARIRTTFSCSEGAYNSSHCRHMGSSELAIGQTFSKYHLLDKLG